MQKVKSRNNVRVRLAKQLSFKSFKINGQCWWRFSPADRSMSEQQQIKMFCLWWTIWMMAWQCDQYWQSEDKADPVNRTHGRADPRTRCSTTKNFMIASSAILDWKRSGTRSQCKLASASVIWSERRSWKIIHTDALSNLPVTNWRHRVYYYAVNCTVPTQLECTGAGLLHTTWLSRRTR